MGVGERGRCQSLEPDSSIDNQPLCTPNSKIWMQERNSHGAGMLSKRSGGREGIGMHAL